ncbi:MAG TPA: hypothetical protein VFF68_10310 [Anaerolineaceae bacterium]|nr:hypothetical protein [Anaerolineaceae bacterium]
MRPGTLRALIVLATMALMAFTLPRFGAASLSPALAAALPATGSVPLPAGEGSADLTALAPPAAAGLPAMEDFAARQATGERTRVTGVYVPGLLAFRVVQQPSDNIFFIDPAADAATQYQLAANEGTVGLLAHNFSGGAAFALLDPADTVWLVFGDGSTRAYRVEQIRRYRAIDPQDPYGSLIDLDTEAVLDSSTVFELNYTGDRLVFQTCIEQGGDWSWGRLFVVAAPVEG